MSGLLQGLFCHSAIDGIKVAYLVPAVSICSLGDCPIGEPRFAAHAIYLSSEIWSQNY